MCGCNKKPSPVTASSSGAKSHVAVPTVDTSVWGPPLWKALHTAAQFTVGDQNVDMWNSVLLAMLSGLPCPDCSAHYNAWYRGQFPSVQQPPPRSMYRPMAMMARRRPPPVAPQVVVPVPIHTRLLGLHNEVNQRTGKSVWDETQMNATYGGDKATQVAAAMAALQTVQGFIGTVLFASLMAVLQSV